MSQSSKILILPLIAGCGWLLAMPAAPATEPGHIQSSQTNVQNDYSGTERDPFRACVATHANDPHRHQNCTWEGEYRPKR